MSRAPRLLIATLAIGLVVLKCVTLKWVLELGLPVPERAPA